MAYQEIEKERVSLGRGVGRRRLRKERTLREGGKRVSIPREGVNRVLRPLWTDWSLRGCKSRGGPSQKVPDSPFTHFGRSLLENPL